MSREPRIICTDTELPWQVIVDLDGRRDAPMLSEYATRLHEVLGAAARIEIHAEVDGTPRLPPGVVCSARRDGAQALAATAARAEQGHLVVLLGPVIPDGGVVRSLLDAFKLDPMVGLVVPRFVNAETDGFMPLPDGADQDQAELPRAGMLRQAEHFLTTEHLAACMVLRREVVASMARQSPGGGSLRAALLSEAVQARRRGFRTLVLNRLVVPTSLPHRELYPKLEDGERADLVARFPDADASDQVRRDAPRRRYERLAAVAHRGSSMARLPMLLDARGIQALHNGTSEAVLRLLDGLEAEQPRWEIDLLVGDAATAFHGLARRFPGMNLIPSVPKGPYAMALRLDQPWHLTTVDELHQSALVVGFNILDTIAWDVLYLAPPDLEETWSLVAGLSDLLLFNSEFSRDRFRFRFPIGDGVSEVVTLHSLSAEEYVEEHLTPAPADGPLLVFGNRYDHKAVGPVLEVLRRAFPYQIVKSIGGVTETTSTSASLASGQVPASVIERLFAEARLVIFPSFYEGFGLPVVKGLAYGKTVVVRASPLWKELAGQARLPGRLVEFVTPVQLVEVVGRALHGHPLASLPLGEELGGEAPLRWRNCARRIIEGAEMALERADHRRWHWRDRILGLRRSGATSGKVK